MSPNPPHQRELAGLDDLQLNVDRSGADDLDRLHDQPLLLERYRATLLRELREHLVQVVGEQQARI
jgi:hypothetical protein